MKTKLLIIPFLLLSVCCSANGYSQSLAGDDMDRYVACRHEIAALMDSLKPREVTDEIWNYNSGAAVLSIDFALAIFNDSFWEADAAQIEKRLQNYLKTDVPAAVENVYIKNGWPENGHVKFWTVYFIVLPFAAMGKFASDEETRKSAEPELLARLSRLFHEDDVALVGSRYEYIKDRTAKPESPEKLPPAFRRENVAPDPSEDEYRIETKLGN